jgi:FeS assembly SUF system protein
MSEEAKASNSRNPIAPGLVETLERASTPPPRVAGEGGIPLSEPAVIEAIKTVYDPEIPVNIYEIGLIYAVDIQEGGHVKVTMTLTSPGCPAAQEIPENVKDRVEALAGVTKCDVEIVWDPQWNPSMMSEAARLELGMF